MGYDIVGDVHGHADELEALLLLMGYRQAGGRLHHPGRHLVFVGDLIDRGPEQLRVIDIARRMQDAGNATIVLGNHEWNAIGWATENPAHPGSFLRDHRKASNRTQHQTFLDQVGENSRLHNELIAWMKSLPLWLDLEGFRVVHACWHQPSIDVLRPLLSLKLSLTDATLLQAHDPGSEAYRASEIILKGLEVPLPDGFSFLDKDGHRRQDVRIRWWEADADTIRLAALCDDDIRELLPDTPLPADAQVSHHDRKPTFFGHYWLKSHLPWLTSNTHACLDFSVARGGHLVAYRWDGEDRLSSSKLIWA